MKNQKICENIAKLLNTRMHGNALRRELEKLFEIYGISEYKIIRTKRGYLIYVREG